MDGDFSSAAAPLLQRIRNMWEFANLCQWIYIFGRAAKIDEALEIEDIEADCLKPTSVILSGIGLALLKLLSSHRGLTQEIFDEQLRKQYISRLPDRNPLGVGDSGSHTFSSLDIPTKIIVLQQLTQWIMEQPERLRDKMEELKDTDQTSWRIEPYGWDADDRTYYVLDDNRVYCLSEAPEAPLRKSKKAKTYSSSRRSSTRFRKSEELDSVESLNTETHTLGSNLGGMHWECVAVTLDDVRGLVDSFRKTRDANEKVLRDQLDIHLVPILEKQNESRKRKEAQRQRELLSLAKMAHAKRSSRIASKIELQKEEERAKEEQERVQKELEDRRREEQKRMKLERERDFRMFSREKRLRERAARRNLHQEELAQLSEGHKSSADGPIRASDRQLQSEIDRNKQALQALDEEDDEWVFDCACGLYGQVDDGAHSIACERCNVWQHSNCVGIEQSEADRAEFQFVCGSCKRQLEAADTPRRTVIKLRIKSSDDSIPRQANSDRSHEKPPVPSSNYTDTISTAMDTLNQVSGGAIEQEGSMVSKSAASASDSNPLSENRDAGGSSLQVNPETATTTATASNETAGEEAMLVAGLCRS